MKNIEIIREMMKMFNDLAIVVKRENPAITDVEALKIVKTMMNKSIGLKEVRS